MNKKLFLFWVLANGVAAVLLVPAGLAFETSNAELAAFLPAWLNATFFVSLIFFGSPIVSMVLPGLVSRKFKPGIPLFVWIFAILLFVAIWFGFESHRFTMFRALPRFDLAIMQLKFNWDANWFDVLFLPWHGLVLSGFILPLVFWLPGALLQSLWHQSWRVGLRFGLAMAAANLVQLLAQSYLQFLGLMPDGHFSYDKGLQGLTSADVNYVLGVFLTTCCGAAMSGLVLAMGSELKMHLRHLKVLAVGVMALSISGPVTARYAAGPNGFAAGFPDLTKAFTGAPVLDVSVGKNVLTLVSTAAISPPRYLEAPAYAFAQFDPSGQSFVTFDENRNLVVVSARSGAIEHVIAGPFGVHEYFSFAWSRDGRVMLLRTGVSVRDDPFGTIGVMKSRIRIFNLPDYTLASDRLAAMQCPNSGMTEPPVEMLIQQAFVMYCTPYPEHERNMPEMIRVPVDANLAIERIDYDAASSPGRFQQLLSTRLGSFVVREEPDHGRGVSVWLKDLDGKLGTRAFAGLGDRSIAGGMTLQGVEEYGGEFVVRFCGTADEVANPPEQVKDQKQKGFCRNVFFDRTSLSLLRQKDHVADPNITIPWTTNTRLIGPFSIESIWDRTSKTGKMIISNSETGKVLQQLTSVNQWPAAFSNDQNFMVTYAFDLGQFRVYRIDAAAAK